MLFKPGTPLYAYEVEREADENVMYINYLGAPFVPSLAESAEVMAKVVDYLIKTPDTSRIVFVQQRNYSYDSSQIFLLREIASLYTHLVRQEKVLSVNKLAFNNPAAVGERYNLVNCLIELLKAGFKIHNFMAKARED